VINTPQRAGLDMTLTNTIDNGAGKYAR